MVMDNSSHVYKQRKLPSGLVVCYRLDVPDRCPEIFDILSADTAQCLRLLPASVHQLVKRTRIWVNHSYQQSSEIQGASVNSTHSYGLGSQAAAANGPVSLTHLISHHSVDWLVQTRDNPNKVLGIEMYSAMEYCRMRLHWNGCGLLLHEICHLIHQQVLPDGLLNSNVQTAYDLADRSGLFDQVLRRDWAGKPVDHDMAYCMLDHKEFFSELSVTFLAHGHHQLDYADPSRMSECCPTIFHPDVQTRLEKLAFEKTDAIALTPLLGFNATSEPRNRRRHLRCCCFNSSPPLHCNKFYPFTRGQLYGYHRSTYFAMEKLWETIAQWRDPEASAFSFMWTWFLFPARTRGNDGECGTTSEINSSPGSAVDAFPDTVSL